MRISTTFDRDLNQAFKGMGMGMGIANDSLIGMFGISLKISRQIMMSKLKWRNANATDEIRPHEFKD